MVKNESQTLKTKVSKKEFGNLSNLDLNEISVKIENSDFIEDLQSIRESFNHRENINKAIELGFKDNFIKSLTKCLEEAYNKIKEDLDQNPNEYIKIRNSYVASYECVSIVCLFSNSSAKFCREFIDLDGIKILTNFTKLEKLINAYIKLNQDD